MSIKVVLGNASHATESQIKLTDEKLKIDRSIYQRLGSLLKNKNILEEYENNTLPAEFKEFLDNMNKFYTGEETADYVAIDAYLAELGFTEEYKYSKDVVNIPLWLETDALPDYRVLAGMEVSGEDLIYHPLIDPSGNYLINCSTNNCPAGQ